MTDHEKDFEQDPALESDATAEFSSGEEESATFVQGRYPEGSEFAPSSTSSSEEAAPESWQGNQPPEDDFNDSFEDSSLDEGSAVMESSSSSTQEDYQEESYQESSYSSAEPYQEEPYQEEVPQESVYASEQEEGAVYAEDGSYEEETYEEPYEEYEEFTEKKGKKPLFVMLGMGLLLVGTGIFAFLQLSDSPMDEFADMTVTPPVSVQAPLAKVDDGVSPKAAESDLEALAEASREAEAAFTQTEQKTAQQMPTAIPEDMMLKAEEVKLAASDDNLSAKADAVLGEITPKVEVPQKEDAKEIVLVEMPAVPETPADVAPVVVPVVESPQVVLPVSDASADMKVLAKEAFEKISQNAAMSSEARQVMESRMAELEAQLAAAQKSFDALESKASKMAKKLSQAEAELKKVKAEKDKTKIVFAETAKEVDFEQPVFKRFSSQEEKPKAKPAKKKPASLAVSKVWVLRAATPSEAWLSKGAEAQEFRKVRVGDDVSELGIVKAIREKAGVWEVVGSRALAR